jgi:hypothetical protein
LVGERNFGANCTNGAVIQDKFATNTSGSSVPNACLLTIGAELFSSILAWWWAGTRTPGPFMVIKLNIKNLDIISHAEFANGVGPLAFGKPEVLKPRLGTTL